MNARDTSIVRDGDTGLEQRCSRCHEWWPVDAEFFNADKNTATGRARWCCACCSESRQGRRLHLTSAERQPEALRQGLPW